MSDAFEKATGRVYDALTGPKSETVQTIIEARDEVLQRFRPLFAPERAGDIEEHEFMSFLHFRNNKHWTGLDRTTQLTSDMDELREGLDLLVDDSEPLAGRFTRGIETVKGMGKATATAILQVAHPGDCGVWNSTSEHGLKSLNVWPRVERGSTIGQRYARMNEVLVRLAEAVDTDLWTLDALWGVIDEENRPSPNLELENAGAASSGESTNEPQDTDAVVRFGLERYLQEFLRDNWAGTDLAAEWDLYAEEGNPEAGFEYPVNVGYIDLLARHREEGRWLVIELKRGQTSDQTAGQVLRYMGAVRRELAEEEDAVEGLIIAHEAGDRLRYAVGELPSVDLQLYDVEFHLRRETTR